MNQNEILQNKMLADIMIEITKAKKQNKIFAVVDLKDYCDFLRIGWSDPPPLIDKLLEKLGAMGYTTYAKLVKDTKLKIEWEPQMTKEITAREARKITTQQIPAALWDKIFASISDAANKGQRKAFIDLEGYFDSVYVAGSLLTINPLLRLLLEELEFLGYSYGRKPPIDTIHPEIAAWVEINW